MSTEINDLTALAFEGGGPLTTTPVVGSPQADYTPTLAPGVEPVAPGTIRVTIRGSGDPFELWARPATSRHRGLSPTRSTSRRHTRGTSSP
jgi:hypothetical protein